MLLISSVGFVLPTLGATGLFADQPKKNGVKKPPIILYARWDPEFERPELPPLAPEDAYLKTLVDEHKNHPGPLRPVIWKDAIESTSIPEHERKFHRLLFLTDQFVKRGELREALWTNRQLVPQLQSWESLSEIEQFGFADYTDEQKIQSEYYFKTILQTRLVTARLEDQDSLGAVVTAREIVATPERDRALLAILLRQGYAGTYNGKLADSMEKAEKTLSFISENGKDVGYVHLALDYSKYQPKKSLEYLQRIKHDVVIEANAMYLHHITLAHDYIKSRIRDPHAVARFLLKTYVMSTFQGEHRLNYLNEVRDLLAPLPLTREKIDLMLDLENKYRADFYREKGIFDKGTNPGDVILKYIADSVINLEPDDPLKINAELRILESARWIGGWKPWPSYEIQDELVESLLKDAEIKYRDFWAGRKEWEPSEFHASVTFFDNEWNGKKMWGQVTQENLILHEMQRYISVMIKRKRLEIIPMFAGMNMPVAVKERCYQRFARALSYGDQRDVAHRNIPHSEPCPTSTSPSFRPAGSKWRHRESPTVLPQ